MSRLREAWKKMSLKKKIIVMTTLVSVSTIVVLLYYHKFARVFKRIAGCTPTEYRANILASRKN